ncbi:hypothetical protein FHS23_004627 [Prauserella isguenensis]|uniref:Uncharacterized protein n=1 Tax=Prauserella isguenensis TaxID=1470180 RepID=A0A839S8H5_9PSEU|nr:hypothetical protein [Prauserella isguenensis]MBB3053573.1 hypothetical protein [Prauserella isguenensis]
MAESLLAAIDQGRVTCGATAQLDVDGFPSSREQDGALASLLLTGCIVLNATGPVGSVAAQLTPYGRELLTATDASHA